MNASLNLLGRILLAVIFLVSGYGKIAGAAGTAAYFGQMGFPAPLVVAYLVGAFELLGGIAIVLGWQMRAVGIVFALFCVATALLAHTGDQIAFMKNLAMAGGFLVLAGSGATGLALDKPKRESRYA
ncbi:DoxX family protein [Jiella sp. M17.18]|uniref:DoxX family protein n=1 Tax=Jiella sp. M17.18 TaxID=3234247 RepID=UPI0034DEC64A